MMDLLATSSSDNEEEESFETPAAAAAARASRNQEEGANLNETHDEGALGEKGAEEVDGNGENKGDGLLSGLIDQAKYISQSLDSSLTKLMKLRGNIQEASTKLRQNREHSERTVESLQKISSDISSFSSKMTELRGRMDKGKSDRVYSVEKITQESEDQVAEEYDPNVQNAV